MEWSDESAPRGLDLPRLFSAVMAHKRWIVLPTIGAFVVAVGVIFLVKPRYTATAKVMLENRESYFTRPEKAQPDAAAVIDDLTILSEAEAAKSPEIERAAMAKLSPEDVAEYASNGWLSLFSGRGADADDRRLENFAKRVEIYPQAKTKVLLFEFTSSDRARAARAANALAESFLESQQGAKDAETKAASKWLSGEIDSLRQKVAVAEARIEELRGKSGLLLTGASGVAVPSQQLGEIATQIATARAAEAGANAKAASLKEMVRSGRLDDVGAIANDESLRRYADSRVALKSQIAELGRTLLPGHPRMKELAGQLAGLELEIRAAAMKRVKGYEEEARISATQVRSLQQAVNAQAQTVTSSDAEQVKLRELEIDAKTAREQLESYLTKYREAIARGAANAVPANGRIIARALAPGSPTFPKAGPLLMLAPLAGFFVSLGLVIAKILLADGGAVAAAGAPVAATRREPQLPFGIDPLPPAPAPLDDGAWSAAVERFIDRLADTAEGECLPLMVAGEAGAMPAALVAARRLARRGPTALVDLGPSPAWLSDLFDGAAGERGLYRDLSTPLEILPSKGEEVGAGEIGAILEALAERYDFLVVHAPDWREPAAVRAVEDMAAMLIAAPAAEIARVEARARAAYRDAGLAIKAIGLDAGEEAREQAA